MLTPVQSVVKERNQLKRSTFDIGYHTRQLSHMFSINCVLLPRHLFGQLNTPQNMFFYTETHISKLSILIQLSRESVQCTYKRKKYVETILVNFFLVEVVPANRSERSQNSLSRRCLNCGCQSQHPKLTKTCGVYLGGGQITETCKHLTSKL